MLIDSTFSAPLRILRIPLFTMASFASTPAPKTELVMRDFTIVRNNSMLGDEISMRDTPPPRMVQGPQWLRDAYQSICHELNRLDRVIAEMQLNQEDPDRNAPGLCKAYNMLLRQQYLIFEQQLRSWRQPNIKTSSLCSSRRHPPSLQKRFGWQSSTPRC